MCRKIFCKSGPRKVSRDLDSVKIPSNSTSGSVAFSAEKRYGRVLRAYVRTRFQEKYL